MSTVQIGDYADNWRKYPALAPQKVGSGILFIFFKREGGHHMLKMN